LGRVGVVLVAAGRSTRMGGVDKLWAQLADRPVLAWSLGAVCGSSEVTDVALVIPPDRYEDSIGLSEDKERLFQHLDTEAACRFVSGGKRRRDSVAAGLQVLDDCDWVLVHDAARPFLTPDLVRRGLEAACETGAAVPVLPARDTIKRLHDSVVVETLLRAELYVVQTPQVFRRELLVEALRSSDEDVTDEATLVERLGGQVRGFPGDAFNFKITTGEDLELARAVVEIRARGSGR
jgi:2-C-methyl-D-erythritol 4-phosphate cytidylyltransferase